MKLKFKTRFFLLNAASIALTSAVLVLGVYSLIAYQMRQETMGFLKDEFNEYSLKYETHLNDLELIELDMVQHFTQARMTYPIVCRIYDSHGNITIEVENESGTPKTDRKYIDQALQGSVVHHTEHSNLNGGTYWFALRRMESIWKDAYVFELGLKVDRLETRIARLQYHLFLLIAGTLILSLFLSWFMTHKALKPLNVLNRKLKEIRANSLDQRLPVRGTGDELDELVKEINQMLRDIDRSLSLVKEFTADAAHELRTPLSRLSVILEKNLESSDRDENNRLILDDALEQTFRLQQLIDDLLLLARLDSGEETGELIPCDISQIAYDLEELWCVACEGKQIQLTLSVEPIQHFKCRPVLMRRLIMNLVENAIRYSGEQESIQMTLHQSDHAVVLSVWNSGVTIHEHEIQNIFRRFYRGDPSRNAQTGGTGLGLSICRKIVELHQGHMEVCSEPQKGTRFTIHFPVGKCADIPVGF